MPARVSYVPAPTGWVELDRKSGIYTSEPWALQYNLQEATFALSLVVQFSVLGASIAAFLQWDTTPAPLRIVLVMETIVQGIEAIWYSLIGFMYVWGKWSINTGVRYIDWMFTTPVMLVSIYLFGTWESDKCISGTELFEGTRRTLVSLIVIFDLLMLFVGAAYQNRWSTWTDLFDFTASCGTIGGNERMFARKGVGIFWGWLPFLGAFGVIIAGSIDDDWYGEGATGGLLTLYLSFVTWAIYGVVAILGTWETFRSDSSDTGRAPYFSQSTMNTWYNLLDIVSKNVMGIVISSLILNNSYDKTCYNPPSAPPLPPLAPPSAP